MGPDDSRYLHAALFRRATALAFFWGSSGLAEWYAPVACRRKMTGWRWPVEPSTEPGTVTAPG